MTLRNGRTRLSLLLVAWGGWAAHVLIPGNAEGADAYPLGEGTYREYHTAFSISRMAGWQGTVYGNRTEEVIDEAASGDTVTYEVRVVSRIGLDTLLDETHAWDTNAFYGSSTRLGPPDTTVVTYRRVSSTTMLPVHEPVAPWASVGATVVPNTLQVGDTVVLNHDTTEPVYVVEEWPYLMPASVPPYMVFAHTNPVLKLTCITSGCAKAYWFVDSIGMVGSYDCVTGITDFHDEYKEVLHGAGIVGTIGPHRYRPGGATRRLVAEPGATLYDLFGRLVPIGGVRRPSVTLVPGSGLRVRLRD